MSARPEQPPCTATEAIRCPSAKARPYSSLPAHAGWTYAPKVTSPCWKAGLNPNRSQVRTQMTPVKRSPVLLPRCIGHPFHRRHLFEKDRFPGENHSFVIGSPFSCLLNPVQKSLPKKYFRLTPTGDATAATMGGIARKRYGVNIRNKTVCMLNYLRDAVQGKAASAISFMKLHKSCKFPILILV